MKNYSKFITLILFALFLYEQSYAQKDQNTDFSRALKVGDTFVSPKKVKIMRGTEKSIDWEALQDKVVLLDFFSTSCGTCIQIMPHLQELEKKHPDKLKVIVVTAHDKATLVQFFKKNEYLKGHQVNLPVIYADRYFHGLFPHKTEPHEILLYQGKVQAVTGSGSINEASILKLYADKSIDLPLKDDYGKGNVLHQLNNEKKAIKAGAFFSGYQKGVPYQAWTFEHDSVTGLYKSSIYNASLYSALLSLTTRAKIKDSNYIPRMDRVLWKVKDSTQYYDFDKKDGQWRVDHAVSYERYDLKSRPDSVQARIILADFLSFYGLKAYEAIKTMECLILKPCPVKTYTGKALTDIMTYSNSTVFAMFTDYAGKFPPTVDQVRSEGKMEIGGYESLEGLNTQLAAYGIKAELAEAEMKVLVIEEVDE